MASANTSMNTVAIPTHANGKDDGTRTCIYVDNLPEEVGVTKLYELFTEFGRVNKVVLDLGIASVYMQNLASAEEAVKHLNDVELNDKKIQVRIASQETSAKKKPSSASIKIANLSPEVTNERLTSGFSRFGDVQRAVVVVDHKGQSTTTGIVEFDDPMSAQNAVKQIEECYFLLTWSPRPVTATLMEPEDSVCGLPEEKMIKTPKYYQETKVEPRFASLGSFSEECARTWKIRLNQENQQRKQFEENMNASRKIFELQMEELWNKQQEALMIKQEMLSHSEEQRLEGERKLAIKRMRMDTQTMEIYQRDIDEGRYRKISKLERQEMRNQVVSVYKADGDWQGIARMLHVPPSTAYRWVQEGYKPDGRGGSRTSTVTEQHRECMVHLIESVPKITLDGIVEGLQRELNLTICKTTITRHLDGVMYSLQAEPFQTDRANTVDVKMLRKEFVDRVAECQSRGCAMVYMDANNYNVHTSSHIQGRFKKGTRCTTVAAASKGANIHFIAAVSNAGLLNHQMQTRPFTKQDVLTTIRGCLVNAAAKHGPGPVAVVMNSATVCPVEAADIFGGEVKDFDIIRLPPLSPMLNPMEYIWSMMKLYVRKELPSQIEVVTNDYHTPQRSVSELRCKALGEVVGASVVKITPAFCANSIADVQGKAHGAAAKLEDLTC